MSPRARRSLMRWYRDGAPRPRLYVMGIDDGPFPRKHRGDVLVVGVIYQGEAFHGMVTTRVRRDGRNSTSRVAEMILGSRYAGHLHALLLDGIALAGFNVLDLSSLERATGLPLLVVVRRQPDMASIRRALSKLPGGRRKWRLIEQAGPMEQVGALWVQRSGLSLEEAEALLALTCFRASYPEPLRAAHIVAGAVVTGEGGRRP